MEESKRMDPNKKQIILAALALLCIGTTQATETQPKALKALPAIPAEGLIVYKLHSQDDEFAPCVEYANIKLHSTVANMTTLRGKFFSVQRPQMVYHIDFPSPNAPILTDADIEQVKRQIKEYQLVSKRFKRTAPLLAPWVERFRLELSMWEQGFGRADGKWVNRYTFSYDRERARLREDFEARKARILGTRDPSLVDEKGPLWAVAMEELEKAEQAKFREQYRQRAREKQRQRTEEFYRNADQRLTGKTPKLGSGTSLDRSGGLDKSGSLNGN